MDFQGWPFLVSRNKHLDYRTIVAPDFLCEIGSTTLLARAADGDSTVSGQALFRHVIGTKAGDFSIIYQVIKATANCLDPQAGDEILKDSFGREIFMIEGLVFKEEKLDSFIIKEEHFEHLHRLVMEAFKNFWDAKEPPNVMPSHILTLAKYAHGPFLKLLEVPQLSIGTAPDPSAVKVSRLKQADPIPQGHHKDFGSDDLSRRTNWLHPRLLVGSSILALLIVTILLTNKYNSSRKELTICEELQGIAIREDAGVVNELNKWQGKNRALVNPNLVLLTGYLEINKSLPPVTRKELQGSIENAEETMSARPSIVYRESGDALHLILNDYPLSSAHLALPEVLTLAKPAYLFVKCRKIQDS